MIMKLDLENNFDNVGNRMQMKDFTTEDTEVTEYKTQACLTKRNL